MRRARTEAYLDLNHLFRRAEDALLTTLRRQKAAVAAHFGALRSGRPSTRLLQAAWEGIPQPIEFRVAKLRGLKNKLPAAKYVLLVTLYDRLGGHPLRWSRLGFGSGGDPSRPAATTPVRHRGRFHDIDLPFNQCIYVTAPAKPDLRPEQVFVFELFQLAGRHSALDITVGWAVLPACDRDFLVPTGKFRLPLLRGPLDFSVYSYSAIETSINRNLDSWLCNLYLDVSWCSREADAAAVGLARAGDGPRTVNEFDVVTARTSEMLRIRGEFRLPKRWDITHPRELYGKGMQLRNRVRRAAPDGTSAIVAPTSTGFRTQDDESDESSDEDPAEGGANAASANPNGARAGEPSAGGPSTRGLLFEDREDEEDDLATAGIGGVFDGDTLDSLTGGPCVMDPRIGAQDLSTLTNRYRLRASELVAASGAPMLGSAGPLSSSAQHLDHSLSARYWRKQAALSSSALRKQEDKLRIRHHEDVHAAGFAELERRDETDQQPLLSATAAVQALLQGKPDPGSQLVSDACFDADVASGGLRYTPTENGFLVYKTISGASDAGGLRGLLLGDSVPADERTASRKATDDGLLAEYGYSLNRFDKRGLKGVQISEAVRKLRFLKIEILSGLHPGKGGWLTPEFWIQVLILVIALWLRIYLHYLGQYLFLRGMRVPVYELSPLPYAATLKYVPDVLPTEIEIGVVVLGPLSVSATLFVFMMLSGIAQTVLGHFPEVLSRFFSMFGIAAILDPLLILAVDGIAGRFDCRSRYPACAVSYAAPDCTCSEGDAWKLAVRFRRDENSPIVGVILTVFIYIVIGMVAAFLLYSFLLHWHLDGRMTDHFRRIHGPEENFTLPHDLELSATELQWILEGSRRYRGPRGTTRKVAVCEYILTDPSHPSFREVSTHIIVYNQELDGTRDMYRHFLRLPDGYLLEVFGDVSGNVSDGASLLGESIGALQKALLSAGKNQRPASAANPFVNGIPAAAS
jgi:hypothetical protein